MGHLIGSRKTADANAGARTPIMAPTHTKVRKHMEGFTKALLGLKFYDVGKGVKGPNGEMGVVRNNRPINDRQAAFLFNAERQFLKTWVDPIIEYIGLDAGDREAFLGIRLSKMQGVNPLRERVAFRVDDINNLTLQWEELVQRFCEITGFKR